MTHTMAWHGGRAGQGRATWHGMVLIQLLHSKQVWHGIAEVDYPFNLCRIPLPRWIQVEPPELDDSLDATAYGIRSVAMIVGGVCYRASLQPSRLLSIP